MRIPDISNRLFSDRNATLESELETAALNFWFMKKMAHRLAKLRIGDTNPDLSATPLAPVSFIELLARVPHTLKKEKKKKKNGDISFFPFHFECVRDGNECIQCA